MGERSDRDIVRYALLLAIEWADSLADANRGHDAAQVKRCKANVAAFKRVLKRRYGETQGISERIDAEAGPPVSIFDLMTDAKEPRP
jgi:hypothetical protein